MRLEVDVLTLRAAISSNLSVRNPKGLFFAVPKAGAQLMFIL